MQKNTNTIFSFWRDNRVIGYIKSSEQYDSPGFRVPVTASEVWEMDVKCLRASDQKEMMDIKE